MNSTTSHNDRSPSTQAGTKSKRLRLAAWAAFALVSLGGLHLQTSAAESAVKIAAYSGESAEDMKAASETAVFAGGCFWGIQGVFQHTKGVTQAVSGYAGGSKKTAVYEIVGSGLTGHAESVQVTFDPKQITYAQLLQIYFSVAHDPTQLNRQYPDSGTQYRSAIFYTNDAQKQVAERYIAQLDSSKAFPAKIVTQLTALPAFYAAEDYHQDYATLHPESGYISTFDLPKIANLKSMYASWYRADPVLVAGNSKVAKQN